MTCLHVKQSLVPIAAELTTRALQQNFVVVFLVHVIALDVFLKARLKKKKTASPKLRRAGLE